ncbi:TPA: hypothetical protein H1940_004790 [Salmonella enterica]|nr:hypothetical protein [Salmonella enterica]
MNSQKFVGKKVKVKMLLGGGVWSFDEDREYEILMDGKYLLHIVDNTGLPLCLFVSDAGNQVYAPGVEHLYSVEVMA